MRGYKAGSFKKISIAIIAVVIFVFLPCDKAISRETRVIVSVSIGTGLVVGAVGLFIHLTYSSEIANLEYKADNGLVLFPDIRSTPPNDLYQISLSEDRDDNVIRAHLVGIRW